MSPTKALPLLGLGLAGILLAGVALRAPQQDYVAPTEADVEAHREAPHALSGVVPTGCAVREIEVSGMCCRGCTGKVYDRLAATPGFVEGAVDFEAGVALVVAREDAAPESFAKALRFDKYDAKLR